jgi:N-acetylglucosamine-6-phosphate deacetylase
MLIDTRDAPTQRGVMRTSGLIDLQVNGFAGVDFNSVTLTADALDHALAAMLRTGVTTCLATLITASEDALAARFAALDEAVARSRLGPTMVPGYHLEGPFLNPEPGYAGCHPPAAMVAGDPGMLDRLQGGLRRPILLLTLAPECPGAAGVLNWARRRGVVVAIGHSAASAGEVTSAAASGARLSTHLGNGLPQLMPKFNSPLFWQLAEDRMYASFIADGIHIPPFALKVLTRAKSLERTVLVTDATAAANSPVGRYEFAGMTIERTADASVRRLGTPTLAGSALTLDQAVRNVVTWGIAPDLATAVRLASGNPAAVIAPALDARGLQRPSGEVSWTAGLTPIEAVTASGTA